MLQQLQLFECDLLHRNGNTALKILLSRLPQGSLTVDNAKIYCQKLRRLSIHDIKDIIFEAKKTQIPTDVVELLFAIPCENHQNMYQKSLAHAWFNRSFDAYFTHSEPTSSLRACHVIEQWESLDLIKIEESVKIRISNLMLNLDPDVMQSPKNAPIIASLFFNVMLELKHNTYSAIKAANVLNHIADVLSDDQCKMAQQFFENFNLWNSVYCENLYAKAAKIQNNAILSALTPSDRSAKARKI